MSNDDKKKEIGPGSLAQPAGSPFLLSRQEWFVVQRYVGSVLSLPTTEADLRLKLDMPATMAMAPFARLLHDYAALVPHATEWKKTTFPATVALANDIVHYASEAPVYYGAITKNVNKLLSNGDDGDAKKQLAAVIKRLATEAKTFEERAKKVYAAVKLFAEQTATDTTSLDELSKHYATKFGDNSQHGKDLAKDLKETNELITQATQEYEYDKAVACATPAYAWIVVPPFGLIAAVIVAGIYGDKAVKAKERLDKLKKDLAQLTADQALSFALTSSISLACAKVAECRAAAHSALPVIQRIQGAWSAIHSDLAHIGEIIDKDIDKAILEIKDLGVDIAIDQWHKLAVTADAYRANAYIDEPAAAPAPAPAPAPA